MLGGGGRGLPKLVKPGGKKSGVRDVGGGQTSNKRRLCFLAKQGGRERRSKRGKRGESTRIDANKPKLVGVQKKEGNREGREGTSDSCPKSMKKKKPGIQEKVNGGKEAGHPKKPRGESGERPPNWGASGSVRLRGRGGMSGGQEKQKSLKKKRLGGPDHTPQSPVKTVL